MRDVSTGVKTPATSRLSPCRLQNEGGRTRKRYGFVDLPSLTMKYPSSPFGDSMAWYVSPAAGLISRGTLPTIGPSGSPSAAWRMIRSD